MPKGKLYPGYILIVFLLLTGSHSVTQNLLKNSGFETQGGASYEAEFKPVTLISGMVQGRELGKDFTNNSK